MLSHTARCIFSRRPAVRILNKIKSTNNIHIINRKQHYFSRSPDPPKPSFIYRFVVAGTKAVGAIFVIVSMGCCYTYYHVTTIIKKVSDMVPIEKEVAKARQHQISNGVHDQDVYHEDILRPICKSLWIMLSFLGTNATDFAQKQSEIYQSVLTSDSKISFRKFISCDWLDLIDIPKEVNTQVIRINFENLLANKILPEAIESMYEDENGNYKYFRKSESSVQYQYDSDKGEWVKRQSKRKLTTPSEEPLVTRSREDYYAAAEIYGGFLQYFLDVLHVFKENGEDHPDQSQDGVLTIQEVLTAIVTFLTISRFRNKKSTGDITMLLSNVLDPWKTGSVKRSTLLAYTKIILLLKMYEVRSDKNFSQKFMPVGAANAEVVMSEKKNEWTVSTELLNYIDGLAERFLDELISDSSDEDFSNVVTNILPKLLSISTITKDALEELET